MTADRDLTAGTANIEETAMTETVAELKAETITTHTEETATTDTTTAPVKTLTVGDRTFKLPHVDAMPPLTVDERARLTADIKANGIKTPMIVTDADEILDGHNRLEIAAELGLPVADIPLKVEARLTADQRRHLAVTLNVHRRQLSAEQVRDKIAALPKADPEVSDRQIAEQTKVDHKTVGRARKKLTASGALPRTTKTKGKDGRTRTRPPMKPTTAPKPPAVSPDTGNLPGNTDYRPERLHRAGDTRAGQGLTRHRQPAVAEGVRACGHPPDVYRQRDQEGASGRSGTAGGRAADPAVPAIARTGYRPRRDRADPGRPHYRRIGDPAVMCRLGSNFDT